MPVLFPKTLSPSNISTTAMPRYNTSLMSPMAFHAVV